MEKIFNTLELIKNMNSAYGLSNDAIGKLQSEMADAKVCTPIIGKFSSGKSALVNTLLGYSRKILKEDITPETAIPAEIVYSDIETIKIENNDGTYKEITVQEYRDYEADASTVKSARIYLKNSFLKRIPDVMLVDMPGFESGFEIHNKAIDNYVAKSLAYIIAFPADDMIVRSSVGNILKELCLHDMPLCIVVTKCDKMNDEFEETFAKMKESLKRFVGNRELRYCKTSSFDGEAEELERFLTDIQEQSQTILYNNYKRSVLMIIENTENYLVTTLKNSQLSESELDEKEENLQKQLVGLETGFSKEKENFETEIEGCIENVKSDVQMALEAEESTFVTMAMNNQSINELLNNVVRTAVTNSVKKYFVPKVEKYIKRVENCINGESVGDVHISFYFNTDNLSKNMTGAIVAVTTGLILGLPVIGAVAGIVAAIANVITNNKKREEAKQQIRAKLRGEVFPQILNEVGQKIEMAITKQITLVNTSIEDELKNQRDVLEKAMADLRGQINDEKERKENLAIDIQNDLERIKEMKVDIQ